MIAPRPPLAPAPDARPSWATVLLAALLAAETGAIWGTASGSPLLAALVGVALFTVSLALTGLIGNLWPTLGTPAACWRLLLGGTLALSAGLFLLLAPASPTWPLRLLDGLVGAGCVGWALLDRRRGLLGRPGASSHWFTLPRVVVSGVLATGAALLLSGPASPPVAVVSYAFFHEQLAAGGVAEVAAGPVAGAPSLVTLQGRFAQPERDPSLPNAPRTERFITQVPPLVDQAELGRLLSERNLPVGALPVPAQGGGLLDGLGSLLLVVALVGGLLWVQMRGAGGRATFGGATRARRYDADATARPVRLADVAGVDEAKQELAEVVDFLNAPAKFLALGARVPRGVLLVGPPGAGKTLLARAVAGEAGVPFFSISGSEFVEMFVGVGASRVRDLFAQAKKQTPCIVFIDEIDAIGRGRGAGPSRGGNEEREQTLNQILVEMDGFDGDQAVIVLAATNRADVLDPALVRPGRFDRQVIVQAPDRHGREAILRIHARAVPFAGDVDLAAIAAATPGLVGAEIANLVNEAALLAARQGRRAVTAADFALAQEKIILGPERRIVMQAAERERVAYHEAGHALLGLLQPEGDPVRRVTIIPRGRGLGVTLSIPEDDRYNYSEAYLRARIVCILGGRAAEEIVYGVGTSGAENDIKQATRLARAMVTKWGMSPEIGLVDYGSGEEGNYLDDGWAGGRPASEATARAIDAAVRRIIDECHAAARDLLTRERHRLESLTVALIEAEALGEAEIIAAAGLDRPARLVA